MFETAKEYTGLAKHIELVRRYSSCVFDCVYESVTSRYSPLSIKRDQNRTFKKTATDKTRIQFSGEVANADWIARDSLLNADFYLLLVPAKVLSNYNSIWSDILETQYINEIGAVVNSLDPCYVTDFIDVTNNAFVDIIGKATESQIYKVVFFGKDKEEIVSVVPANEKDYIRYSIPEDAYYMRATLSLVDSDIWLYGHRSKNLEDITALTDVVEEKNAGYDEKFIETDEELASLQLQLDEMKRDVQNGRINILMVDLLQSIKANTSTLNTIGPFNIVSSTENSITLSAEDYGNIDSHEYQGLCIEIPTGTNYPEYKNAIFRKSENNTLVQIGTSVDLSNAVRCSSIHDTVAGGNGIHLSPFGYRSLACTISEMLTMKDCYNYKNYIGGFVSMDCKQGIYNTANIEATDGTVLVEPIRVNAQKSGFFPQESGYSNKGPKWGYIENVNENLGGFSGLTKQFTFQQYKDENTQEVSIELPFNFGRKRGYLVIEGNTDNESFPGTALLEVIENGVVIWSVTMNSIAQKYVIGIREWSAFSVKVSLLENKVTKAMLSAVCFYEMYDGFEYPNLSGKNIAVLGDSWCTYNDITTSKHFLGENNEDCENFGQYPDGTSTEYYSYCALFPKYLAHITGGNVDNWGRGGTTSANWGLVKIDHILDFKSYDYMVIEFFTNDKLGGMSVDTWRRNLQEICRKCIKKGVQPIVIMPCVNQGTGFSFAQWNNYLLQGLYFGLD